MSKHRKEQLTKYNIKKGIRVRVGIYRKSIYWGMMGSPNLKKKSLPPIVYFKGKVVKVLNEGESCVITAKNLKYDIKVESYLAIENDRYMNITLQK